MRSYIFLLTQYNDDDNNNDNDDNDDDDNKSNKHNISTNNSTETTKEVKQHYPFVGSNGVTAFKNQNCFCKRLFHSGDPCSSASKQ